MRLIFEWDNPKARLNLAKHGISFQEASTVFGDPYSITISDSEHFQTEARFIILGRSYNTKILVVVHTERGDNVRIISARPANRKERRTYEENL